MEPRAPYGSQSTGTKPSTLYGHDLTGTPHWREELRAEDDGPDAEEETDRFPRTDNFVSLMGFRFAASAPSDEAANDLTITVHDAYDESVIAQIRKRHRLKGTLVRTVVMPACPRYDELTIVVSSKGADIFAGESAWDTLAEPVLLTVAQYARYSNIEQRLVTVQDQAGDDYRYVTVAGLRSLVKHRRLTRAMLDADDLVGDWACFAWPRADPSRSCSSEESLADYKTLATALDIYEWTDRIEELASDIDEIYKGISEKLLQYRQFVWEVLLEVAIVFMLFDMYYAEP